MPANNQFCHQSYPSPVQERPVLRRLTQEMAGGCDFSQLHSRFGVRSVLLVHGTLVGDDPFGVAETLRNTAGRLPLLAGIIRHFEESLRQKTRTLTEHMVSDVGNYSQEYSDAFSQLVGGDPSVQRLEPTWSGQNHHLARADLAVRVFDWLLHQPLAAGERVLLWGHSHAGNAFALLTNLLANDREAVQAFFQAAGAPEQVHWRRTMDSLNRSGSPHPLAAAVDIATFGTPVRYGWDILGCRSLIHLTHHRTQKLEQQNEGDGPRHTIVTEPVFPPQSIDEIVNARYGDWVQAAAIAGTDVATPSTMLVQERLGEFLERSLPESPVTPDLLLMPPSNLRRLLGRWKTGTRCHADGFNLLVEYVPSGIRHLGLPLEHSLFGHGVATTIAWLPVHLNLVMQFLSE